MAPVTHAISVDIHEKRYPGHAGARPVTALRNLRASVAPSEFCVITGPSGCGKTTLLNIIAGLDREFSGTVRFEPTPAPRIGYVFQNPRLLPWRTVRENVALVVTRNAASRTELDGLLADVGVLDAADAYPSRLSGGMARRVRARPRLCDRARPLVDGRAFSVARCGGGGPVAQPAAPARINTTRNRTVRYSRSR